MPSASHQILLESSPEQVWSFVSNFDNWVPLVKGYASHQNLNERTSIWVLKGEAGRIQKTVKLRVDITKQTKPNHIAFSLKGINENVRGNGCFTAKKQSENATLVTGDLTIKVYGLLGPVLNPIITTILPMQTQKLAEAIRFQVLKQQRQLQPAIS